ARSGKTIASAVATFAPVPRWRGARAALGPFRGRRIAGATLLRRGIAEPLPPARVAAAAPRLIPGGRDDVLDRHRGLDLHLPRLGGGRSLHRESARVHRLESRLREMVAAFADRMDAFQVVAQRIRHRPRLRASLRDRVAERLEPMLRIVRKAERELLDLVRAALDARI